MITSFTLLKLKSSCFEYAKISFFFNDSIISDQSQKLKKTGNRELLHTGPRIDTYWGINSKEGENHHGKILMEIRKEL